MTNEALLAFAGRHGYYVEYVPLEANQSFTIETQRRCNIFIRKRLPRKTSKVRLAHELGHCEYGGFYNRHSPFDIRSRAEHRADKWAYYKLLPPEDIRAAMRHGYTETWQIADYFDVTCEFAQQAIEYYKKEDLL